TGRGASPGAGVKLATANGNRWFATGPDASDHFKPIGVGHAPDQASGVGLEHFVLEPSENSLAAVNSSRPAAGVAFDGLVGPAAKRVGAETVARALFRENAAEVEPE